jgi:endonuclease/exonuclease/phosphatase family metal-dependent hydrolase
VGPPKQLLFAGAINMKLTVLQWNIWIQEPIEHIAEFLRQTNADVMCLQELTTHHPAQRIIDTREYLAGELGYHYFAPEIPIDDTIRQANGIFSRYPLEATSSEWINRPRRDGDYDDQYRAYVQATVRAQVPVTIGTTHSSYTDRFEQTPAKQGEADLLAGLVSQHSEKFVFCADLNSLPGSYTVKALEKHLEHAGSDLEQPTWTTKPFSHHEYQVDTLTWRLDYVFHTPDIKPVSAKILETDYSDHLPVLTEFEI